MDSICLSICHETTFLIEMLFDSRVRMFIISVFIIAERRVYQIRLSYFSFLTVSNLCLSPVLFRIASSQHLFFSAFNLSIGLSISFVTVICRLGKINSFYQVFS